MKQHNSTDDKVDTTKKYLSTSKVVTFEAQFCEGMTRMPDPLVGWCAGE